MEIHREVETITLSVDMEEFRVISAALINMAAPGTAKLATVDNAPLKAAVLNEKLINARKNTLTQWVRQLEAQQQKATEVRLDLEKKEALLER